MKIGYARLSNNAQDTTCLDALTLAGCQNIVSEQNKDNRKGLNRLINSLQKGDTVVVWKLNHLGLSINDMLKSLDLLRQRGVEFVCLMNNIDTSTTAGKMVYTFLAEIAESALSLKQERASNARIEARKRGKVGGRPKGPCIPDSQIKLSVKLREEGLSIREIAERLGISKSTVQRLTSA